VTEMYGAREGTSREKII